MRKVGYAAGLVAVLELGVAQAVPVFGVVIPLGLIYLITTRTTRSQMSTYLVALSMGYVYSSVTAVQNRGLTIVAWLGAAYALAVFSKLSDARAAVAATMAYSLITVLGNASIATSDGFVAAVTHTGLLASIALLGVLFVHVVSTRVRGRL